MNPEPSIQFLSVDEALEIHRRLIEEFGGKPGVRDLGLLDSVLFRPRSGHYEDVAEMGAALFESTLANRPFVDGNRRMAFFGTDVFLRLNGWWLDVDPGAAFSFMDHILKARMCDFKNILPRIQASLQPL